MTASPPRAHAVELVKYEGLGNDFLVLLDLDDPTAEVGSALARAVCDRHRGFGADGLIRGRRAAPGSLAALTFELWNADGSEAEMSGNGMRCLAHAALDAGLVDVAVPFVVDTPAGGREVRIDHGADPASAWTSVDMGVPVVDGGASRCNVGHGQLRVSMGNPHLVVAGPDPATIDVATLGARLSAAEPQGRNVEFATLGPGPDEVTIRIWERGVGETLACGTGACAAAVAYHHWGRVGSSVTVHQPGGSAVVRLREDRSVLLAGPSRRIGACTTSLPGVAAVA